MGFLSSLTVLFKMNQEGLIMNKQSFYESKKNEGGNKGFLAVPSPAIPLFVVGIAFLALIFLSGCTEQVPGIPYTTAQLIARSTDLNYSLFLSGYYDGNCLGVDGNLITVKDCNGGGVTDVNWSDLTGLPIGCPAGQAIQILDDDLTCIAVGGGSQDLNSVMGEGSWTDFDLNMNGNSIVRAFDVNATNDFHVGNTIFTAYLCDNFGVGCWDLTGDPHYFNGMDLRLGQDLWVDGNVFPFTTLWSNLGSGANRWDSLFVRHVNAEDVVATGDVNGGSFYGDGSHLTGISVFDTNAQTACADNEYLRGDGTCQEISGGTADLTYKDYPISGMNTQGLIAYWTGNNSVVDYSETGNDGTLTNGATYAGGVLSQGMSFDGTDDYVNIASLTSMPAIDGNKSIVLWLRPDAIKRLIALSLVKNDTSGAGNSIDVEVIGTGGGGTGGELKIQVGKWGGTAIVEYNTNALSAGTWYHTAYTYDGTTHRLYVNGIERDTDTGSGGTGATGVVRIGSFNAAYPTPYWDGNLDEVMIFNRALSTDEIKQIYYSQLNSYYSLYVPYSGALYSLDMGDKNISTTKHIFSKDTNAKHYFGASNNATIYFDGSGLVINPNLSTTTYLQLIGGNLTPIQRWYASGFEMWVQHDTGMDWWLFDSTENESIGFFDRNNFLFDGKNLRLGIGTASPTHPLTVDINVSEISVWGQASASFKGYITRTEVYDKNQGTALSKIKDASAYFNKGLIDHNLFDYSKVSYDLNVVDKIIDVPYDENVCTTINICDFNYDLKKEVCRDVLDCHIERKVRQETTYKIVTETGVSLDKEVALIKQAVYELKTLVETIITQISDILVRLNGVENENARIKQCAKDSIDYKTYQTCVTSK
jgi:hypothetical protein